jgi:hypothetical protein
MDLVNKYAIVCYATNTSEGMGLVMSVADGWRMNSEVFIE